MTTQSSRRVSPVWDAVLRGFTPDPVRLSGFSRIVSIVAGLANILVLALIAFDVLRSGGDSAESFGDDQWSLRAAVVCGILILLWAGAMANIKAARWVITALYATVLAAGLSELLDDPQYRHLYLLPWFALSLAVAAHPLFLRKRHTE